MTLGTIQPFNLSRMRFYVQKSGGEKRNIINRFSPVAFSKQFFYIKSPALEVASSLLIKPAVYKRIILSTLLFLILIIYSPAISQQNNEKGLINEYYPKLKIENVIKLSKEKLNERGININEIYIEYIFFDIFNYIIIFIYD